MNARHMQWLRRMAWAGVLLLAGCASYTSEVLEPRQGTGEDGATTVTIAPAPLACDQARCPTLSALWSSKRAGVVVLVVGLPQQAAAVTGADFHFGRSQVVRLRVPSETPTPALGYPATAFDAPLNLIDALAYKPDGWVRVMTADSRAVQETVRTGEEESRAVDAMRRFLRMVDGASGTPPEERGRGGGLFDLLK